MIVEQLGGVWSPYSLRTFESTKETDIEHVIAISEAHDSELCAATAATRRTFAQDLWNLTLTASMKGTEGWTGSTPEWYP